MTERDLGFNEDEHWKHLIHILDVKPNVWHTHEINIQPLELAKQFNIMDAHDGRLAWFGCIKSICYVLSCKILNLK
jgi:hypothetical protein